MSDTKTSLTDEPPEFDEIFDVEQYGKTYGEDITNE